MNKIQQQVREFHAAFGAPIADKPTLIPKERWTLRDSLIEEELSEYWTAADEGDLVEIADALGDLLYVVFGAAIEHGIDLEPVVDEIHRSNMSKLGEDGKPIYREDGKILKGPGYFPPNIAKALEYGNLIRTGVVKVKTTGTAWSPNMLGRTFDARLATDVVDEIDDGTGIWYTTIGEDWTDAGWNINVADPTGYWGGVIVE